MAPQVAKTIAADSPAARYLQEHGVALADFNTYGSRRGNHVLAAVIGAPIGMSAR